MSTANIAATNETIADHVAAVWADDVLPMLHDYIRIPCVSQAFDPDWKAHGFQDQATEMIRAWCATRTWKPPLSITGVDGIPPVEIAGNVLRAHATR